MKECPVQKEVETLQELNGKYVDLLHFFMDNHRCRSKANVCGCLICKRTNRLLKKVKTSS